jgi:small-conductance mechanosensitive channel
MEAERPQELFPAQDNEMRSAERKIMIAYLRSTAYFNNTLFDYAVALGTIVVAAIALWIIKSFILLFLRRLAASTAATWDNFAVLLIDTFIVPLGYLGIIYLVVAALVLPPAIAKALQMVMTVVLTVFGIRFILSVAHYGIFDMWLPQQRAQVSLEPRLRGLMPALSVLIWGIGIVFILDNLGFDISAIVAALGIGGIAMGLAASAVLGDAFAYLAILCDRPFELGDFIIVDSYLGSVEHIGMKTTRLRSLSGEQLVFSNKDLTNSRLHNYKRMRERRIVFIVGVTYGTTLTQLKEAPQLIKSIIDSLPDTRFDRSHFSSFADFSLNIETVYYVLSPDYNMYMDIQQAINLQIKEAFEQHDITFAFPTQTLYVINENGRMMPPVHP